MKTFFAAVLATMVTAEEAYCQSCKVVDHEPMEVKSYVQGNTRIQKPRYDSYGGQSQLRTTWAPKQQYGHYAPQQQYHQPSYGQYAPQPSYGHYAPQPSYGCGYGQRSAYGNWEPSKYEEPKYEEPKYEEPKYEEPEYKEVLDIESPKGVNVGRYNWAWDDHKYATNGILDVNGYKGTFNECNAEGCPDCKDDTKTLLQDLLDRIRGRECQGYDCHYPGCNSWGTDCYQCDQWTAPRKPHHPYRYGQRW
jgi:hypothetical protein